jgi:hypothetical protein
MEKVENDEKKKKKDENEQCLSFFFSLFFLSFLFFFFFFESIFVDDSFILLGGTRRPGESGAGSAAQRPQGPFETQAVGIRGSFTLKCKKKKEKKKKNSHCRYFRIVRCFSYGFLVSRSCS